MKTPMALSVTSSQREQTSLRFQVPRLPRSNVCSTRDLENPSASVHLKRFSTPSLTLKFLCAGKLNPRSVCLAALMVWPGFNVRYAMPIAPALAVLAGLGWDWLAKSNYFLFRWIAGTMLCVLIAYRLVLVAVIMPV